VHRLRIVATIFLVLGWLLGVGTAAAETVRVEREGFALVGTRSRDLRKVAVQSGIRGAVIEVAAGMVGLAPDASVSPLRRALGTDLLSYTERFQILEDRGVGPRLREDGSPTGEDAYVVWMEVYVDESRVKKRLRAAGLLAARPVALPAGRLLLEVRGVRTYAALEMLKTVLLDSTAVRSVLPREFEAGRVLFAIETRESPDRLLARLVAGAPVELALTTLPSEGQTLVVRAAEGP